MSNEAPSRTSASIAITHFCCRDSILIRTSQMNSKVYHPVGGYSDSETEWEARCLTFAPIPLITAAGQRRTFTGLSPCCLMADPHQNRR